MVSLDYVGGYDDEDADNTKEHIDNGPPSKCGKARVTVGNNDGWISSLNLTNDGGDEYNQPGNLVNTGGVSKGGESLRNRIDRTPTAAMDVVARAKGSPITLDIDMPLRPEPYLDCSIFRSEGECREP
jgi:hypothetical protein